MTLPAVPQYKHEVKEIAAGASDHVLLDFDPEWWVVFPSDLLSGAVQLRGRGGASSNPIPFNGFSPVTFPPQFGRELELRNEGSETATMNVIAGAGMAAPAVGDVAPRNFASAIVTATKNTTTPHSPGFRPDRWQIQPLAHLWDNINVKPKTGSSIPMSGAQGIELPGLGLDSIDLENLSTALDRDLLVVASQNLQAPVVYPAIPRQEDKSDLTIGAGSTSTYTPGFEPDSWAIWPEEAITASSPIKVSKTGDFSGEEYDLTGLGLSTLPGKGETSLYIKNTGAASRVVHVRASYGLAQVQISSEISVAKPGTITPEAITQDVDYASRTQYTFTVTSLGGPMLILAAGRRISNATQSGISDADVAGWAMGVYEKELNQSTHRVNTAILYRATDIPSGQQTLTIKFANAQAYCYIYAMSLNAAVAKGNTGGKVDSGSQGSPSVIVQSEGIWAVYFIVNNYGDTGLVEGSGAQLIDKDTGEGEGVVIMVHRKQGEGAGTQTFTYSDASNFEIAASGVELYVT